MKTYPILAYLTDEMVERVLASPWAFQDIGTGTERLVCLPPDERDGLYWCPLGVAFGRWPMPGPWSVACDIDRLRNGTISTGEFQSIETWAAEFMNDVDDGKIRPEDLPEIVRLSRGG